MSVDASGSESEGIKEVINTIVESVDVAASIDTSSVAESFSDVDKYFASFMLLVLAVIPIIIGSFRSLKSTREIPVSERFSQKDAKMFPIFASCALLGLYLLFRYFSKEYVNYVLTAYFFLFGVFAVQRTLRVMFESFVPASLTKSTFKLELNQTNPDNTKPEGEAKKEEYFSVEFDHADLVFLALSCVIGAWYIYTKHWIANNIFGLAFCINGIEMFPLGTFSNGAVLLGGLFFYDIFWVFGTDVMVTVAKSFDAPIKILFPKDLLINGFAAKQFTLLGLGDIVIPGVLIALLLRFDRKRSESSSKYFSFGMFAYVLGLGTTMVIMHAWNAAQPALLYLSPSCVGIPAIMALLLSELKELLAYKDFEDESTAGEVEKKDQVETLKDEVAPATRPARIRSKSKKNE